MKLVIFVYLFMEIYAVPLTKDENAMLYLQKYGYMEEATNSIEGSSPIVSEETVMDALKDFQRFAGLNQTGELDNNTVTMMKTPRCGVKDMVGQAALARRKRYAHQGSKWSGRFLTYSISKYPRRMRRHAVDREVGRAFRTWSAVTDLTFRQRRQGTANIDIRFQGGEHGDGDPFDGRGKTLAHAYFPQFGGAVHFDDDETWTVRRSEGTNLFQIAAHEVGHSLGLAHSDERTALMAPYYRGYDPNFRLHRDDIAGIQTLYGTGNKIVVDSEADEEEDRNLPPVDASDAPDLCQNASIDIATRSQNGSIFVFKGDYYWRLLDKGIADGYPRKINEDWDGLEGDLDASLNWANGKTFFFKGGRYWRFTNKKMNPGYPKSIRAGFEGIPDKLDAALVWGGNGKTYFFKGDQYWRYDSKKDPPISDKYPKQISNWKGLPNDIDACFQSDNSRTYFFKGDKYYKFNDDSFEVEDDEPPYPRPTSDWWFDCQSILD